MPGMRKDTEEGEPVKRALFDLSACASLLLCIATLVVWARSYSGVGDYLHYWGPPRVFEADSYHGLIRISFGNHLANMHPLGGNNNHAGPVGWQGNFWPFQSRVFYGRAEGISTDPILGFQYFQYSRDQRDPPWKVDVRRVTYSDASAATSSAVLPVVWTINLLRRRERRRRNRCTAIY
jgi:hypothetical protein